MVLKVKEPVAEEYHRMREGQTLFTYLHLAADKPLTEELVDAQGHRHRLRDGRAAPGSLPLLAPMSEVAGRLAPQVGAHTLMRAQGGRGVLMGGVRGVYAAKVVVIGAGVAGMNAAAIALGMRAEVHLLDSDIDRLRRASTLLPGPLPDASPRTPSRSSGQVIDADLVIGAVLVPGAKAPKLVTNEQVAADEAGLGARRHRHRPGRLLRGLPPDHARRPDLPGARLGLLLRREHARRRAAHVHLRPHQRDAAYAVELADQGWQRRARARPRPGARAEHARRARSPTAPVAEAHGMAADTLDEVLS